jgi:hypothetical protein
MTGGGLWRWTVRRLVSTGPTVTGFWGCLFKWKGQPWVPFLSTLTYFSSLRAELLLSIHSYLIDSSFDEIGEHPSALLE